MNIVLIITLYDKYDIVLIIMPYDKYEHCTDNYALR